jgi:DNA-binding Xre family transcriptional regulator
MSAKGRTAKVTYRWHLRMIMAERGMFATSDLVPLLAARGVMLSREQVYRLVAKIPERVNLTTLAALCDILECTPADLIEPVRSVRAAAPSKRATPRAAARDITPRRARVAPDTGT